MMTQEELVNAASIRSYSYDSEARSCAITARVLQPVTAGAEQETF